MRPRPETQPKIARYLKTRRDRGTVSIGIRGRLGSLLIPPVAMLVALTLAWEIFTRLFEVPTYMVPKPTEVAERLSADVTFFAANGAVTLLEALAGFILGSTVAFASAILMTRWRILEQTLFPLAVIVKVTPVVAVAPLLVVWFGFGSLPIVSISALITFFPVLVNTVTGLKSVDTGALNFFRSVNTSPRETFLKLRLPGALPYLFAAFRIAIPLSVIGAVVGEFFGGNRGLGGVIFVAHHNLDMPTSFAAILILATIGVSLTVLTSQVERRALFWHDSEVST